MIKMRKIKSPENVTIQYSIGNILGCLEAPF